MAGKKLKKYIFNPKEAKKENNEIERLTFKAIKNAIDLSNGEIAMIEKNIDGKTLHFLQIKGKEISRPIEEYFSLYDQAMEREDNKIFFLKATDRVKKRSHRFLWRQIFNDFLYPEIIVKIKQEFPKQFSEMGKPFAKIGELFFPEKGSFFFSGLEKWKISCGAKEIKKPWLIHRCIEYHLKTDFRSDISIESIKRIIESGFVSKKINLEVEYKNDQFSDKIIKGNIEIYTVTSKDFSLKRYKKYLKQMAEDSIKLKRSIFFRQSILLNLGVEHSMFDIQECKNTKAWVDIDNDIFWTIDPGNNQNLIDLIKRVEEAWKNK